MVFSDEKQQHQLDTHTMTTRATVVRQGWLEKKGEHLKLWSKRYLVLYDDGTFNGYKAKPNQQEIVELGGKLENQFTVKSKCRFACRTR